MSQMKAADLAVVKALPGNDKCADCPVRHPQWASVSHGTVICLECSGVHRSLGVHISFVRSIAMDAWTPKQLALMKAGGNDKCNTYLSSKGTNPGTPIKQKYDNDAAKLYKEVLKARAEGKPEPTSLPTPAPRKTMSTSTSASSASSMRSNNSGGNMNGIGGGGGGSGGNKVEDPNGMERLTGETDEQYIARQTRLRDEAKARMAAKFGGGGGGSSGGFGSSGPRTMGGVGSSPHPSQTDTFSMDGLTSSLTSGASIAASGVSSLYSSLSETVKTSSVPGSVTETGLGLWKSISTSASNVASQLAAPDGSAGSGGDGLFGDSDGLQDLNRRMRSQGTSTYSGFGSDDMQMKKATSPSAATTTSTITFTTAAATATSNTATGGDPNGVAPLPGESDAEYMQRQIRIRDEAKKRMQAKFGKNPNLGTASSAPKKVNVIKMKADTNDDFFSSFGA